MRESWLLPPFNRERCYSGAFHTNGGRAPHTLKATPGILGQTDKKRGSASTQDGVMNEMHTGQPKRGAFKPRDKLQLTPDLELAAESKI